MKIKNGTFLLGDCLELMKDIPSGSVDMILCDLPYGTTACSWDSVIPFAPLWEQYWRIAKPNAAIVLTAAQPFTSALVMSQRECFEYCWYWIKNSSTGFTNAKKQPMRKVEDILIFYRNQCIYNPQNLIEFKKTVNKGKSSGGGILQGDSLGSGNGSLRKGEDYFQEFTNYPTNVLEIPRESKNIHPTQKPVALFEYLIKTYTNPGETVLDNCAGSGTTAIAAQNTNRKWICIEQLPEYYYAAVARAWQNDNS